MCSNERGASTPPPTNLAVPQYQVKLEHHVANTAATSAATPAAAAAAAPSLLQPIDHYRLQLYNYAMAERLRFGHHYPTMPLPLCPGYAATPYGPRLAAFSMSLFHPRALQPEEPKPQHSYIGLIAMAILSSPESRLVLSQIYDWILEKFPYFRSRGPGWRNSVRHNLSLNDCFIKAGRSPNGKGHFWAVHPCCVEDFKKGDFRRRKAQRKVRKHMGLAVDEEGNDSPSPPPVTPPPPPPAPLCPWPQTPTSAAAAAAAAAAAFTLPARKRQFDVASLLAPDNANTGGENAIPADVKRQRSDVGYSSEEEEGEVDIDVVSSEQDVPAAVTAAATGPWQQPAFPGPPAPSVLEQQLVSRYYEQLQQHHRRLLQQQQQKEPSAVEPADP